MEIKDVDPNETLLNYIREKLNIKYIPKIKFYLDDTFDEAQKIEKLLLNKKLCEI